MRPKFWSNHRPRKQQDPLPVDVGRSKTLLLEPPGKCQQRQSHYRKTNHENRTRQTALCPPQRRSLHPRSSEKPPLSLAFENTPAIVFRGRGIVWFIHMLLCFFISQYNSLFWVLREAPAIFFTCLFGHQQRIMENYLNKNIASR